MQQVVLLVSKITQKSHIDNNDKKAKLYKKTSADKQ